MRTSPAIQFFEIQFFENLISYLNDNGVSESNLPCILNDCQTKQDVAFTVSFTVEDRVLPAGLAERDSTPEKVLIFTVNTTQGPCSNFEVAIPFALSSTLSAINLSNSLSNQLIVLGGESVSLSEDDKLATNECVLEWINQLNPLEGLMSCHLTPMTFPLFCSQHFEMLALELVFESFSVRLPLDYIILAGAFDTNLIDVN